MTDLKDQFFDFVNIFFFFYDVFGGLCRLFLCRKKLLYDWLYCVFVRKK